MGWRAFALREKPTKTNSCSLLFFAPLPRSFFSRVLNKLRFDAVSTGTGWESTPPPRNRGHTSVVLRYDQKGPDLEVSEARSTCVLDRSLFALRARGGKYQNLRPTPASRRRLYVAAALGRRIEKIEEKEEAQEQERVKIEDGKATVEQKSDERGEVSCK